VGALYIIYATNGDNDDDDDDDDDDEVVESLYAAVRSKLSAMLDVEYADAGGTLDFPKDELLAKADEEVRTQVVPVVVDHIMWLLKEERRALGQLDCDMMMVAFAGQFVDTIVTNAVLKTQVDLSGKRSYTRTFVATSSGDSRTSAGPKPILRSKERVTDVWTRWSSMKLDKPSNAGAEGDDVNESQNANRSNNCNTVMARSSSTARRPLARPGTSRQRRRNDNQLERRNGVNNGNNNNNSHDGDKSVGSHCDIADTDLNTGNATPVCWNNGLYLTASLFHAAYGLARYLLRYDVYDDSTNRSWNNDDDACNYNRSNNNNNNNNVVDVSDDHAADAATVNRVEHDAEDGDLCNSEEDDVISRAGVIRQKAVGSDDDNEEDVVASKNNEQSLPVCHDADAAAVDDEAELEQYLSATVDRLLSALGAAPAERLTKPASFYTDDDDDGQGRSYLAADLVLNFAADWLSRYRSSVDSRRCEAGQGSERAGGQAVLDGQPLGLKVSQASVRTGQALLDGQPLDAECMSVVDRAARKLFHSAVDFACNHILHSPAPVTGNCNISQSN